MLRVPLPPVPPRREMAATSLWSSRVTHQVKTSIDLKSSPFLVDLNVVFFSVATDVKHGFLSLRNFHRGHTATVSLDSICPLNSFPRRLKLSLILGLSLPGPLLSLAVAKVVDYALANSYPQLYHQCLSIKANTGQQQGRVPLS